VSEYSLIIRRLNKDEENTDMIVGRENRKRAGNQVIRFRKHPRRIQKSGGFLVNDIHSKLNPVLVNRIVPVDSAEAIQNIVREARQGGKTISISGGRHAMGGQQFGTDTVLIDTTKLNRVLDFDTKEGILEVEAGIKWPELIEYLHKAREGRLTKWGITQKQTGADRLSIGGAIGANIHGRGLCFKPIIQDVESLVLIDENSKLHLCSRTQNPELFRLVIGGYGLFGVIYSVRLRLTPRRKLRRVVEVIDIKELMPSFEHRIEEGFLYGDFQYNTDSDSDCFLSKGVFSCYEPVSEDTLIPEGQRSLSAEDWKRLIHLAHTNKKKAFELYSAHYLSTSGQIYWSDTHQLSTYIDDYHRLLDRQLGSKDRATEMITEIYVPRNALVSFVEDVRKDFLENNVDLIYGTIRLIEKDEESFLAWAKESYACVIFNLHVIHNAPGLERAANDFRRLIDRGIQYGGSYYLTYHKYATLRQVLSCYPNFPEFLKLKKKYDPEERFQSDWYRHYRKMFADLM
jgi:FAD/FMN-containing dehydrogenase